MRRIIVFDRVSADGYFSAPDGNLDWTVPEDELDKEATSNPGVEGTLLFGRKTYQMFESFWPKALEAPGGPENPHRPGQRSPEMRAMAEFINNAIKIVFSRTLKDVKWKNSRLFKKFQPYEVEALKREKGADMMIFGSGSIVSQLAEHDLIDEYQFIVGPVILGNGHPLISGVSRKTPLKLAEAKTYKSGNVKLRYTRQ